MFWGRLMLAPSPPEGPGLGCGARGDRAALKTEEAVAERVNSCWNSDCRQEMTSSIGRHDDRASGYRGLKGNRTRKSKKQIGARFTRLDLSSLHFGDAAWIRKSCLFLCFQQVSRLTALLFLVPISPSGAQGRKTVEVLEKDRPKRLPKD
jgi:hypothetical protein